MESRIALYPITCVAHDWDDEPFDHSVLPMQIVQGVTVEEANALFREDQFDWLAGHMSKRDVDALKSIRYSLAIVHRYQPAEYGCGTDDQSGEMLIRNIAACLRLIRPTGQTQGFMRGTIRDGTVHEDHFENPNFIINVPTVQKIFSIRNKDLVRLQKNAPMFLDAMSGEFWKFRMSVELHEAGHSSHQYWKTRFSLWCSALEALFTSNTPDHKGSLVARERIKWFLNPKTLIYPKGDILSGAEQSSLTVEDIIEDLYELRNSVAHGDKTTAKFYQDKRDWLDQPVSLIDVLHEAASSIIRASLLKILEGNLLNHFADGPA